MRPAVDGAAEGRAVMPQVFNHFNGLALAAALLAVAGCGRSQVDESAGAAPSANSAPGASQLVSGANKEGAGSAPGVASAEPSCPGGRSPVRGECPAWCPEEMVFIPATGEAGFQMGRGAPGSDDQAHQVVLSEPFCMDQTEVTVRAYRACVEAGECSEPQLRDINANYRSEYDRAEHPVNMVNWTQATEYCKSVGKRLPTEAEWEYAASRGDGRKFPWGNEPEPSCDSGHADFTPNGSPQTNPAGDVGCHGGGTSPVKAHPNGKVSWPAGDLYDMGGNVWEWTSDCYLPYPSGAVTDPAPKHHPHLKDSCYVYSLRGGGWNRSVTALRTYGRAASKISYRVPALGFRCASGLK